MLSLLRHRLRWVLELAGRRYATTDITDITLTLALLTDTMDLVGLLVAYSLVPVRGMAGDARGAGVAGAVDSMAAAAGATVAASMEVVASEVDAVS
jgi:hypothetical protein